MRILPAFAVSLLAAVALAAGLPGASATAAPAAPPAVTTTVAATSTATTAAATTTDAVTISVAPNANGVITENGDLTASITVHNGTDQDLAEGLVRVYLDRETFSSRTQLESWFARPAGTTTDALGSFMTSVAVPAIDAGATADGISVTIPSSTLSLSGNDWGAKAFGVRYGVAGSSLTEAHSSVVYYPNDSFQATKLAIAVPLTVPASTSGLISSDALASYTSENGILTQELDAVKGKDVAIGIDPMILASIRILGNVAPPSAIVWLKNLESVPNETFALAYADSDVSVVRQAGKQKMPQPIDFADAIAAQEKAEPDSYVAATPSTGANGDGTGGNVDSDVDSSGEPTPGDTADPTETPSPTDTPTTIPPTSTVPTTASLLAFPYKHKSTAWPLEDTVGTADLSAFTASGISTTILGSGNVTVPSSSTENAASTIGSQKVLVSDDTLSSLVRSAVDSGTGAEWKSDVAHLSAELATLTHERPSDSRTLLTTLGRNWATTGSRLDETLAALKKMTWVTPATMTSALASDSTTVTLSAKKASDARVDAVRPLVEADDALQQFSTALREPQLITSKERLRMLALTSTAWSDNPTGLTSEISKVTTSVDKTTKLISVVDGSPVNILGDRSSLPIVIQNDTASAAVVYLQVVPSNYFLSVEKNHLAVTVQANSQQRVTVPVQSVANGKVELTLSLSSKQGVAISSPTQVAITVRAGWETVITLVFAVAVVLLFGGGIYRSVRRRRRSKEQGEQDPAAQASDA